MAHSTASSSMEMEPKPVRRRSRRSKGPELFGIAFAIGVVTLCTAAALAAIYSFG